MKTILVTCIGTDLNISNPNLLYHFLDYYIDLGIKYWQITLHAGPHPALRNLTTFEKILSSYRISYDVWIGRFNTFDREDRQNAFVCGQPDNIWILGVDLDEFVVFPKPIDEYLQKVFQEGFNAVNGILVDRVSNDGTLKRIEKNPSLQEQFPLVGEVKRNIYKPAMTKAPFEKKIAIMKPLLWGLGHHFITRSTRPSQFETPESLEINHYAWDDLLIGRISDRMADPWADEYQNMIDYIKQHDQLRLQDIKAKKHE